MWTSEDNLQDTVFLPLTWGSGIELRTGIKCLWVISLPLVTIFKIKKQSSKYDVKELEHDHENAFVECLESHFSKMNKNQKDPHKTSFP